MVIVLLYILSLSIPVVILSCMQMTPDQLLTNV